MKQRGSAIVISMLLISAISLIAFGLAKAMYTNTGTVTLYEDGSVAYYAAESGLEEGFLRYRYNQNTEVPFKNWILKAPNDPTVEVFKSIIGSLDGSVSPQTDTGDLEEGVSLASNINKTNQAYDLRIGYLGTNGSPFFGEAVSDGTLASSTQAFSSDGEFGASYVVRDESIKVDLTGLDLGGSSKLQLKAQFYGTGGNTPSDICKALMEVKFTVNYEGGPIKEYTDLIKPNSAVNCDSLIGSYGINDYRTIQSNGNVGTFPAGNIYYNVLSLQDVFARSFATIPIDGDKVILTLRPLYYDARVGLVTAGCDGTVTATSCNDKTRVVAGPFTTVESTGYFGSVVKKLSANIDRQSGTLYDLFDYVINKKS